MRKKFKKILYYLLPILLIAVFFTSPQSVLSEEPEGLRVIRVGAYDNYPKIYTDDNGNQAGIFPDILKYIAEEEDWKLEYVKGTWTECLDRLEKGEIDLMVDVAYSAERGLEYDFTNETVLINWGVIYSRSDANIKSIPDLEGMTIAVMKESIHTVGEDSMTDLAQKFELDVTFIEVEDYHQVFEALEKKEADAGVVNRIFADTFAKDYDVTRTSIVINPIKLKFALPKDASLNEYLIQRIDDHVYQLKKDPYSIYYKSLEEYLGSLEEVRVVENIPKWMLFLTLGIGGLLIGFYLFSSELRRRVKKKTSELEKTNKELQNTIIGQKETQKELERKENRLRQKIKEYEELNRLVVKREVRMGELKDMVEKMKGKK